MASAFERGLFASAWPRSYAELRAAGVSPSALRGPRWRRTSRGFFVPADLPTQTSTTQRILDAAPLIPATGALAGWAAAYVHGVDLLDGIDPFTMRPLPVPIRLGCDLGRASVAQVRYVRGSLPAEHRQSIHRLPVTTALRTAYDGARWAPDLVEAVVFLDQLAHALGIDLEELRRVVQSGGNHPGVEQARQAIELADARSASPWESRLRMFYVGEAQLPRPEVNVPIFDLDGDLLGIGDLLDPEAGMVTEFDGQDHRLRRRHRADNLREEKLEAANLVVCRVDSLDLRTPLPLAERLQARHAQGLRRDRGQDRWTLVEPLWWRRRRAS